MIELNQNIKGKSKPILILFVIVIFLGVYQFLINKKILETGIYTKSTVINSEGYKGGIIITVKYSYYGKAYEGRMNSTLGKSAVGNQYFIKLTTKNPDAVVFLKDNPVPDCLLHVEPPAEGWKEIPECK